MSDQKTCTKCGELKPIEEFQTRIVSGKRYPRTRCSKCENQLRILRRDPIARIRQSRNKNLSIKNQRANGINRSRWLLKDSRQSDKRHGRENDLDLKFVQTMLSRPCLYCGAGAPLAKMTLDRRDNSKGHLKSNVNSSCVRCNWARGRKPLEVWMRIVRKLGKDKLRLHVYTKSRSWRWRHREK